MEANETFSATLAMTPSGTILVAVPFDPDSIWGAKTRHHVSGLVGGRKVRGVLDVSAGRCILKLGPAWVRDNPFSSGDVVDVVLRPEGPQREGLDPDVAAALAAEPEAGVFFDQLAQFYRKAYLTWIGGTKSRPEERARRIAESVKLLKANRKLPK